jgi:hypothetical protein
MFDLKYLVSLTQENPKRLTLHQWTPGETLSDPIWSAVPSSDKDQIFEEIPNGNHVIDENTLYLSMNSGYIVGININNGEEVLRVGPRHEPGKVGWTKFAIKDGIVYDAGIKLYETKTDEVLDYRNIGAVEFIGSKLCIVPYEGIQRGHLVDALTKKVVLKNARPFDGSGFNPGEHITHDGRVYTRHGDFPTEKITIKNLATGEIEKVVPIFSSERFDVHQGVMYDKRNNGNIDGGSYQEKAIVRSDCCTDDPEEAERGTLVTLPPHIITKGIESAGDLGLLISMRDSDQNARIVSHLDLETPLLEAKKSILTLLYW